MMKLAVLDQSFHWPPTGGSWVDLRETALRLPAHGIEPKIFVPGWERHNIPGGRMDIDPGIPYEVFPIRRKDHNFYTLPRLFKQHVGPWNPDAVMISNTFYLAPYIIRQFRDIPVYLRIYAHELICLNYMCLNTCDIFKWYQQNPHGELCGKNNLDTALRCWRCGLRRMGGTLIGPRLNPVAEEYWTGLAWTPFYSRYVRKSLNMLKGIMVYNPFIKSLLQSLKCPVHVVPGGIDTSRFTPASRPPDSGAIRVLLPGRLDDQRKGLHSFRESIRILKSRNVPVDGWVTDVRSSDSDDLLHNTGWISWDTLPELYQSVDIVVCPSIWPEPFGMTALEGMASGLPVVASRIGGFQFTVIDNVTGLHFSPGNAQEMADCIETLVKNPELRRTMGLAGRERAETHFNWDTVVERYTVGILEGEREGEG
jgi:glycosyltransferase involved in cell wall biosynthesis